MQIKIKNEDKLDHLSKEQKDLIKNVKKVVIEEEREKSFELSTLESLRSLNELCGLLNDQLKTLKDFVDLTNKRIDLLELNK